MESALEADRLGKRYGRKWALRDCTLRIPAGRIAALVGPNGAGKSTLLHLAVGLLRPEEGQVRLFGAGPGGRRDRGGVGFVAQDTPLYREFDVPDLIKMGGKLNRQWDAALARERLTALRIPFDLPVGQLSGGQRAQVALALAMAKRPRLLLLDEPVASLDPLSRREFLQELMGSVADAGTTVVLSSHLLADLERVCDYLIVLQDGRIQLAGDVDELLEEHRVLIGPRDALTTASVIRASHTDRQSTLLVRAPDAAPDPQWTVQDVTLEDLVLAYMANAREQVHA